MNTRSKEFLNFGFPDAIFTKTIALVETRGKAFKSVSLDWGKFVRFKERQTKELQKDPPAEIKPTAVSRISSCLKRRDGCHKSNKLTRASQVFNLDARKCDVQDVKLVT